MTPVSPREKASIDNVTPMHDNEVVASIVAGHPQGLALAYDRYADPLYKYCRTLLRDPADAADAVQDVFVIAASRLDGLRDPDRLRGWLYAVARREALRIRRGASALGEAPDVTDDGVDIGHDVERADLRALLEDACDGLNPGEREVIELQLRQGLGPAEVAAVLGVSSDNAHALLCRAREQLGACLAVLLVGRAGRGDCGELDALLAGWDGRLTAPLRERVHRHIEHCAVCGARRAFELRPAMLFDLSPGAALAAGAALSLRLAPGLPEGLRAQTIMIASGQGAGAVAHRAAVLSRAGAFDHSGFPQPVRFSPWGRAMAAAAVVLAVATAAGAVALAGNAQPHQPAASPKQPAVPAAAIAAPTAGQPRPQPTTHAKPTTPPSARPGQKLTLTTAAPASTTAAPSPTTPSPAGRTSAPTPSPTPTPGTLSESPRGGTAADPAPLVLVPDGASAQIDLSGGGRGDWDAGWSVTVADDPGGAVSVSPAQAGTLTPAGATVALTVTVDQFIPCGASTTSPAPTITVEPGGAVYSICTSLPKRDTGGR
jgi:RNA polymerase sigma factor (sigma-70 family)